MKKLADKIRIIKQTGTPDIATLYIGEFEKGKLVEFVESVHPPRQPYVKKVVFIVSSLNGCPVGCRFCDASGYYKGKLSKEEIFAQIDFLKQKRFGFGSMNVEKLKIQFARMGEPSFNPAVLEALKEIPSRYETPNLIVSLSTIAPDSTRNFFKSLLEIKREIYPDNFQLQFSIHSTDLAYRRWLIPVKTWDLKQIASYGNSFYNMQGKKITLNFALDAKAPLDITTMIKYFDPDKFLIKITPINPTYKADENGMSSLVKPEKTDYDIVENLENEGYQVIVSIGALEENLIGSNCGQYLLTHLKALKKLASGYGGLDKTC